LRKLVCAYVMCGFPFEGVLFCVFEYYSNIKLSPIKFVHVIVGHWGVRVGKGGYLWSLTILRTLIG